MQETVNFMLKANFKHLAFVYVDYSSKSLDGTTILFKKVVDCLSLDYKVITLVDFAQGIPDQIKRCIVPAIHINKFAVFYAKNASCFHVECAITFYGLGDLGGGLIENLFYFTRIWLRLPSVFNEKIFWSVLYLYKVFGKNSGSIKVFLALIQHNAYISSEASSAERIHRVARFLDKSENYPPPKVLVMPVIPLPSPRLSVPINESKNIVGTITHNSNLTIVWLGRISWDFKIYSIINLLFSVNFSKLSSELHFWGDGDASRFVKTIASALQFFNQRLTVRFFNPAPIQFVAEHYHRRKHETVFACMGLSSSFFHASAFKTLIMNCGTTFLDSYFVTYMPFSHNNPIIAGGSLGLFIGSNYFYRFKEYTGQGLARALSLLDLKHIDSQCNICLEYHCNLFPKLLSEQVSQSTLLVSKLAALLL